MLEKRKLAWLEQRDKDGQSCSNLYPYHKTAAHSHMTLLIFLTIASTESISHLGYFFKLRLWPNPHDCIVFHFASYGSQDKALKCFIFVEWLMWLKKSSLLIGWLEKRRGAQGARAPLPLNRDRNSFHFDDLPTFERFLESQIEQPQAWSLYAAFYRLTIAPKLLGKGSREPSE